jgi:hypothetical protein
LVVSATRRDHRRAGKVAPDREEARARQPLRATVDLGLANAGVRDLHFVPDGIAAIEPEKIRAAPRRRGGRDPD